MADSRIVYVNNHLLEDPRIWSFLHDQLHYPWQQYVKITTKWNGANDGAYIRKGKNTWPFQLLDASLPLTPIPVLCKDFDQTFSDITDLRLLDLKSKFWDRRWMVQYSGGIDSTLIMCAILRNLDIKDLDNITVCCNRVSVYENPEFFYRYVKPNFCLQDSSGKYDVSDLCEHSLVLDGEPSYVWPPLGVLGAWRCNPQRLDQSLDQPGDLIDLVTQRVDRSFAEWLYESMMINIRSQELTIKNYWQFFWWLTFNVCCSHQFHPLADMMAPSKLAIDRYFKFSHHWYDWAPYQQWSMQQDFAKEMFRTSQCMDKFAAKMYIRDFTRDDTYFRYKGKCTSSAARRNSGHGSWFCILDDRTPLSLDRHLDQIKQLLPGHLNPELRVG